MVNVTVTRILYMEDDPGLARLLQKSLQRRGYIVDVAADGEEGLSKLSGSPFDLLIVDYDMPFFGGIDVIRTLSAKGTMLPTIMVTGQGNEEVAVEALKLGAADYIVKDAEMKYLELLPVVIDRVLYQQHLLRERTKMEETVRESEERYRLLVEYAPDGIAVHAGGEFVFVNPAGARLLGAADAGRLIGVPVGDIVPPEYQGIIGVEGFARDRQRSSIPWIAGKFRRLDGTAIDVEFSAVVFSYGGKPAVQVIFRDISERKEVEARLERLALYDTLTGLPNRTLFFDRLGKLLALAKRNGDMLAILYVDLDHFKIVNETYGHAAGDLLLAEVAKRLQASTRESDTVARLGGDEFIGVCGRLKTPDDASILARKIVKALSESFELKGQAYTISASIGISLFPQDGDDGETLLRRADAAMYLVKERGQGGFSYYSQK